MLPWESHACIYSNFGIKEIIYLFIYISITVSGKIVEIELYRQQN